MFGNELLLDGDGVRLRIYGEMFEFSRKKPGLGPFKEGEYKLVWRSRVQSFVLSTVGYMRVAGEVYIASVYDSVVSC